jgi:primosomal protein N' (replication factor Y)
LISFAKVRIPSPLPQLDKEFDYRVPEGMQVSFGTLVKVPFGKSSSLKTGVVVGLTPTSEYEASVQPIRSLASKHSLLTEEQYELAKDMADRYAGSVSEIIHSMVPTLSVRVDQKFASVADGHSPADLNPGISVSSGERVFLQPSLSTKSAEPDWATQFVSLAYERVAKGESVIVALPDYRDMSIFERALENSGLSSIAYRNSSSDKNSDRYLNYLKASNQIGITYGLRSTILFPAVNLDLILVLDDGDESHYEQTSPYWNTRDVALLRQNRSSSALVFCSHSPSSEVVRLIDIGYLQHAQKNDSKPISRVSDNSNRLDDENYALVAKTLGEGKSVLVQVANLGFASSIACRKCGERRLCEHCGSSIWIDTAGNFRCRSCKRSGVLPDCSCGGNLIKTIRIGSSSIAEWLAKAFPKAKVIHSSGEERLISVEEGNTLVISTPGSEPDVPGGYAAVIVADAGSILGFPSLRAL